MRKARKTALWAEIDENPHLESQFSSKNTFLIDFCGPSGSPGASRDVPGASQNISFLSFIVSCVWKRVRTGPREAPGRPRGSPEGPTWYHFGSNFRSILHVKKHRKNDLKMQRATPDPKIDKKRAPSIDFGFQNSPAFTSERLKIPKLVPKSSFFDRVLPQTALASRGSYFFC